MKVLYLLVPFFILAIACQPQAQNSSQTKEQRFNKIVIPKSVESINKTDKEWKKELTDFEYFVLREKGTERSFSNEYWDNKKEGIYLCSGCGLPLFTSETKYKSGTGWPSFYAPLQKDFISEDVDYDIGYKRTEVLCKRCGGHLGHLFPDGPKPTGQRYCLNSAALNFVETSIKDKQK